jgi:high-affinity nickel-transport protein
MSTLINDDASAVADAGEATSRIAPAALNRRNVAGVLGVLVIVNVLAVVVLAVVSFASPGENVRIDGHDEPMSLFAVGMIAYVLGLRHACDADHIAAIDNVSRRLALLRRDSLFVGGYFSLGHSTVVCIMCIVVAISATSASAALKHAGDVAGLIGTGVSVAFLTIIGAANFYALYQLWQYRKRERMAALLDDADPDADHAGADRRFDVAQAPLGGCFTRCCPRLLRSVDRAWKMYIVGFVFGLGFDTASEIALLSISVITSQQHGSPGVAVLLAFLFTSAMTLVDTVDGILVRWAFSRVDNERKLLYNIGVTAMAALMAVTAAMIELMSLIAELLPDDHSAFLEFWRSLDTTNVGYFFIGMFALAIVVLVFADWRRNRQRTAEKLAGRGREHASE